MRFGGEALLAADAVDGPVARGRDQPRGWVVRHPGHRPAAGGDRERLLCGFLGEIEVAEEADERCEHPSPPVAEDLVECLYHSATGRTSTAPPMRAAGIELATSMA